ncbi:MAG TPA: calcium-binding protein, partial [Armatimonadetes bacterium]|nr:calcium-binding protein [Armatimonadota bacterium]
MTSYTQTIIENIYTYDAVTDTSTTISARTTTATIVIDEGATAQSNLVSYDPILDDGGFLEIGMTAPQVLQLTVDGDVINMQNPFFDLTTITWGGGKVTTLLVIESELPDGSSKDLLFTIGGDPLPAISSAAEMHVLRDSITAQSSTFAHDPGPGNTINLSTLLGVSISEDDTYLMPNSTNETYWGNAGNDTIDMSDITDGYAELKYNSLSGPVSVNIDGVANTGTVVKTGIGTDTLINIKNPMEAGWQNGGLGVFGTGHNDSFVVHTAEETWMVVGGGAGNDSFDFSGDGAVRLSYTYFGATTGIVANLETGIISNDGLGGTDTVTSTLGDHHFELRATDLDDTIIGSAASERFILRGGNDTLDGGAGFDTVRYDRNGVGAVTVNLTAGTATGQWNGIAFTHQLTNVEGVRGSRTGDDTLTGNSADNHLDGKGGSDTLRGEAGNDILKGGDGDDFIFGGSGDDRIYGGDGIDLAHFEVEASTISVTVEGDGLRIVSAVGSDWVSNDVESIGMGS